MPEDQRWTLGSTSPRVKASFSSRTRALDLHRASTLDRALKALVELLGGRTYLTRNEIRQAFSTRSGLPAPGEQLGHPLLIAELRGVVCRGPIKGAHHDYALVDEVLPAARALACPAWSQAG